MRACVARVGVYYCGAALRCKRAPREELCRSAIRATGMLRPAKPARQTGHARKD